MPLTNREMEFYSENGYLLKKRLIPTSITKQVAESTDQIHERMLENIPSGIGISWEEYDDPEIPKRIRQLMHSELISGELNQILRSSEVLDIIETLMGPNISLYHSKLLPKSAYYGTITPWHQDYSYWKGEDNQPLMINCMFFIDAATTENGCIRFVPGSHKKGLLNHNRGNHSFGLYLPGLFGKRDEAVLVEVEPGDCIFFGPLVIHGSDANKSPHHRRANTFAYNVTNNDPRQCREVLRGMVLIDE